MKDLKKLYMFFNILFMYVVCKIKMFKFKFYSPRDKEEYFKKRAYLMIELAYVLDYIDEYKKLKGDKNGI